MSRPSRALRVFVTGAATELGRETTRQLVAAGHHVTGLAPEEKLAEKVRADGGLPVVGDGADATALGDALRAARADVVLHLAPQWANSLLHDGHKWKGYAASLTAEARALAEACEAARVSYLVTGSFALLYGNAHDATEETPLVAPGGDPAFVAAIEVEGIVRGAGVPSAVVRLGYLYGPAFKDLALYERSFRWRRPYLSGPKKARANFVHVEDAARALVAVAERRPEGAIFNAVDGTPASFVAFMDYFATALGFSRPLHIPRWGYGLARSFIAPQHIELVRLVTTVRADRIREAVGWLPTYPGYRAGLDATIRAMRNGAATDR